MSIARIAGGKESVKIEKYGPLIRRLGIPIRRPIIADTRVEAAIVSGIVAPQSTLNRALVYAPKPNMNAWPRLK